MGIGFFLEEYIKYLKSVFPTESKHALDLDSLRKTKITFWTFCDNDRLVGCGDLKEIYPTFVEIKSMRTSI
tara:strand:- start:1238 stop:1450 length:213 start_codon:yes stop_codon:yes gene_type:complete